jgi:hypothetical protein
MFLANIITFHCYDNIAEVFVELGNNITYAPTMYYYWKHNPDRILNWLLCTVKNLLIHYI